MTSLHLLCQEGAMRDAYAAQADLKRKAASRGANVLVIEGSNQYVDLTSEGFRIEAKAYYIPPSDNGK